MEASDIAPCFGAQNAGPVLNLQQFTLKLSLYRAWASFQNDAPPAGPGCTSLPHHCLFWNSEHTCRLGSESSELVFSSRLSVEFEFQPQKHRRNATQRRRTRQDTNGRTKPSPSKQQKFERRLVNQRPREPVCAIFIAKHEQKYQNEKQIIVVVSTARVSPS